MTDLVVTQNLSKDQRIMTHFEIDYKINDHLAKYFPDYKLDHLWLWQNLEEITH